MSQQLVSQQLDLTAVGSDPRWKIAGRTAAIADIKGKRALQLGEGEGIGVVWLDGYDFANGIIELDLLGRSQPVQGSFLGVAFRVVDAQTHDAVYFRPFNFRAEDPVRHSHAVQYVSQPRWPWHVLRSEFPGQYEQAVVPEPDGDEWFHARIVVERPKVSVFVNDASVPCLMVTELSDRADGSLGLWVDTFGGHFANLRVARAVPATSKASRAAGPPPPFALAAPAQPRSAIVPLVAAHQHLMSPAATVSPIPSLPVITLPAEIDRLLRRREQVSGAPPTGDLFTEDAVIQELETGRWERGRERIDRFLGFMPKDLRYVPNAYAATGASGYVAGTVRRGESTQERMNFLLGLAKGPDGAWQIGAEVFTFIPPAPYAVPITADQLIAELDDAGIQRGVVLSVAYWFGSPLREPPAATVEDEVANVRAENDWTVEQVAHYPDRLVAFCGVNPLKDYAIAEIERCATLPHVKGVKVHFANSAVDVQNPEHIQQLRDVFRAANDHRLAIVAHVRPLGAYTRQHAHVILNELLPAVPDVPFQIAHLGSASLAPDEPTAVFADAIVAGDPRTTNLYFDTAGIVMPNGAQPPTVLAQIASALRRIGLHRIFFGSDMTTSAGNPPNPPPREHWQALRRLPLTDDELRVIANNVPPYLRSSP